MTFTDQQITDAVNDALTWRVGWPYIGCFDFRGVPLLVAFRMADRINSLSFSSSCLRHTEI